MQLTKDDIKAGINSAAKKALHAAIAARPNNMGWGSVESVSVIMGAVAGYLDVMETIEMERAEVMDAEVPKGATEALASLDEAKLQADATLREIVTRFVNPSATRQWLESNGRLTPTPEGKRSTKTAGNSLL